jgi:hypothetical protein
MDYKKEKLQHEPGSMQRQTQQNEQFGNGEEQLENATTGEFGLMLTPQAKPNDNDGEEDISIRDEDEIELNDIDDEKIIPSLKAKRNPWNSATFDKDDFLGGFITA